MIDVVLAKAANIERAITRAREELAASRDFMTDYTRQDAAVLNVQRACDAAVDLAHQLVRLQRLGAPTTAREAFDLLVAAKIVPEDPGAALKRMVGFRNIAVHQYAALDLAKVRSIIESDLDDVLAFSAIALRL